MVTAGYAGSRSSHILVDGMNLNVGSPAACGVVTGYTLGCGPGGTAFSSPWGTNIGYFPGFPPTILNTNDVGAAKYDSLQIKAETKSSRHGLYALIDIPTQKPTTADFPMDWEVTLVRTYWPLPGTTKADWSLSQLNLNQHHRQRHVRSSVWQGQVQFAVVGAALSTLSPETGKWISLSAFLLDFQCSSE